MNDETPAGLLRRLRELVQDEEQSTMYDYDERDRIASQFAYLFGRLDEQLSGGTPPPADWVTA